MYMYMYVLFIVRHALLKALKRDDTNAKRITVYKFGFFFIFILSSFFPSLAIVYIIIVCNCTDNDKKKKKPAR